MRRPVRERGIGLVAAVVLFWPLVHLVLVAKAGIDPWELFGWAMYSQPPARIQIRVEVERAGVAQPLRAMGDLRDAQLDFARRRTRLGALASPDDFVAAVFESDPAIGAVSIVLRRIRLDPDEARLVAEDQTLRSVRQASRRQLSGPGSPPLAIVARRSR